MGSRRHPVLAALAALFAIVALLGCVARTLPAGLQTLPGVPAVVALSPWCAPVALAALVLALVSRRWFTAIVAVACLAAQLVWQAPYVRAADWSDPVAALTGRASATPAAPGRVRVMTCNVYNGAADARAIVELVRAWDVTVLALQEVSEDLVARLADAGLDDALPYSVVTATARVPGNGLWSALPLADATDAQFESSASAMPAGTLDVGHDGAPVRFVSVHTTSPGPGTWKLWRTSIDEIRLQTRDAGDDVVLMGDFNATGDHAVFRDLLGDRFRDASAVAGRAMTPTWPANLPWTPALSGIDHVVVGRGVAVDAVATAAVAGSDHRALIATLAFPGA